MGLEGKLIQFEFATSSRILFGSGKLKEVGVIAISLGRSALVVVGKSPRRSQQLIELLEDQQVKVTPFIVTGEPTTHLIRLGVELARSEGCDLVVGCGGGSVLDAGKAIAALLSNDGDVYDYLEVIGKGKTLSLPSLPYIAIPTTAGTGTEVTRNAVLGAPEFGVKVSLRSPFMLPRLALIDPALTCSVPPSLTASTGLDALTQLIEPYVSNSPNPITDAVCREGIQRVARSLPRVYQNGDDTDAREDMCLAALFSGFALANARLGAIHGFAGVLGGSLNAPHGAICARLLPYVAEVNLRAMKARSPQSQALIRYNEIARILTGNPNALAEDGIIWLHEICATFKIPTLSTYGLYPSDFPGVIEKSMKASSIKGNPIALTPDEMEEILRNALGD